MQHNKRNILIGVIVVALVAATVAFFALRKEKPTETLPTPVTDNKPVPVVIGTSVEGRKIESFTFGSGDTHLVFVGGIHGGYEWNSVLLAYTFLDYLVANPNVIPENIKVTIIPSANPDGLFKVLGKEGRFTLAEGLKAKSEPVGIGRFNAHNVDLNRNFDCKWKPESTWRSQKVSAGTSAFSEPEAQAIRDFTLKQKPKAFVFWHSQANAVYASECEKGILPETLNIMNAYAKAAVYPAVASFDAYPVSGDAEGWLASINIPAITVELKTHETVEWEKNLAGVKALFKYFEKPSA
ncbi:MAG TPA: M14 family metallopeptidase [Candidatus Paceibacterota bacterium]|nr:M14 family metallopeptidase [Candidatus Paceibacterota bacterium]